MDAENASAAPAAPPDTPTWLRDHLPSAERWWRLWLADREALRIAFEVADSLPNTARGNRLFLEHGNAERAASLGYISELLTAERLATAELEQLQARRALLVDIDRLQARRARIAELITEVLTVTNPSPRTKP